ncbi:Protein of unknown function (DUF1295) domain containing protein [Naviculisporaceae sp. PSN 640]
MSTHEPVVAAGPAPVVTPAPNGSSHIANGGQTKPTISTPDTDTDHPDGSIRPHHANGGTHANESTHANGKTHASSHHKKSHSSSLAAAAKKDLITRGVYRSNPLGTSTFIGLRALDPLLQFGLLGGFGTTPGHAWGESILSRLGIPSIPLIDHALTTTPDIDISRATATSVLFPSSSSPSNKLSILPTPRLIIFLMATGSSIKQIFWLLRTSKEEFTPSAAISVSIYNTLVNSLASLLILAIPTSASLSPTRISLPFPYLGTLTLPLPMALGTAMYISGLAIETASEIHRKKFKDDPKNKGEICDTGLWAKARHVNYAGYTLWRTGYALAAGGWIAGALVAGWHGWVFAKRSIGLMDEYMSGRYKEKWEKYKKDVPWKLVPFVY